MTVTTEPLGSARVVRWEQAGKLNAWTRETIEAIADAIEAAGADEAVRCVVVRGAGEHFSAGDDLHAALGARRAEDWARDDRRVPARHARHARTRRCRSLAAIDGVCIGGALEFAASCDLRIATDRARFATPEVGIGLVATNAGTLLLPEVLGETAARELLLTGALRDAELGAAPPLRRRGRRARRARRAHRGVGRRASTRVSRTRGRADQGDAQRPPRRSRRRGDGARGARVRRAVRLRRRPGGASRRFANRRR